MKPCLSLPVPLWCRVESTGQVNTSEAAGAAPLLDAHFRHLGCIHPQFFWTDCGHNMAQVTEASHRTSVITCIFVKIHWSERRHNTSHHTSALTLMKCVWLFFARSHLLVFCLLVPFNNNFDMRWSSRTTRLVCPVKNQIMTTLCYTSDFRHLADTHAKL